MRHATVTQRDIATASGVSLSTVSRALSGKGYVADDVKARVLKAAENLGYCPNPLISSLMRCRSQKRSPEGGLVIGWYGPTKSFSPEIAENPHFDTFSTYYAGASACCTAHGFKLNVFSESEYNLNQLFRISRARGVRGVILGPTFGDPDATPLQNDSLYALELGFSRGHMQTDRVVSDLFLERFK